jgi:aromatic-amino-acid transaminase
MTRSIFEHLELAPRDPILGLNEAFNADTRAGKVNLGVGVYTDENGKIPLLASVREAEAARVAALPPRGYLPIDGIAGYNQGTQTLLFGENASIIKEGRVVTIQALGGTGALKIGADFLRHLEPDATVWISDPSWENHRALFEMAGFKVNHYPYYDAASHGVRFAELLETFRGLPARSIVVLHACCHNPTGVDLTPTQWKDVIDVVVARDLIPFLDLAYQGFDQGIEADGAVVRAMAATGIDFFVASSYSKSFSLYGERVGALSIVTGNKDESTRLLSQVKRTIRTNYSNPPTHGATLVSTILNTPNLKAQWEEELAGMRKRIRAMREKLVGLLKTAAPGRDFSFIAKQNGMFSYSGLTAAQVERLKTEFGIYAVSTGRICVAALNNQNIEYVANAIGEVVSVAPEQVASH